MRPLRPVAVLVAFSLSLAGCTDREPTRPEVVRSVKTIVVGNLAATRHRQIAGVLAAARIADLSFAVPGTVKEVLVDEGMSVSAGQVLARLDERVYELALSSALARLSSVRAELEERRLNLERQQMMFEKKLVARAALDRATAEFGTVRAQLAEVESNVARSRRDLERTALLAPYSGAIAARDIEPFQEVTTGQTVLTLQGGEGLLAEVLVPESLIREVAYGDPVSVRFPTLPSLEIPGTVTEIGSRIDAGNAFPVRVRIDTPSVSSGADLRPGLSARVLFTRSDDHSSEVKLIPLSAVAFGQGGSVDSAPASDLAQLGKKTEGLTPAPVFVYDPASGTVRKVTVLAGDIRGNLIEVYDGLEAGDRVVVAGVAFLRDGTAVRLWTPET